MKQKVLWKFEDESLDNLKIPSNVLIRKWFPQSDILAHQNIVLFISHGGLFGSLEGIERGVPMLFIPLYGDQYRNGLRAENSGFGLKVRFADLTVDYLYSKISQLVDTKKYYNRAKEVSTLLRDNLVHPMEEAMYWIEYVARHKGAKHLRSYAVDMPWYTYLLLDVIGFLLLVILIAYLIVAKLIKLLFSSSKSPKTDSKKKKRN